jgi:hypothetical protein
MLRQIYIVDALQVVTSDTHPEGLFSHMPNYPVTYDSRTYPAPDGNPNGDADKALRMARAEYLSRVSAILAADNPTRAMATVTLERCDGVQVAREVIGSMPDMTPPEPEPAEE